jgi:hypothetical protein
MQIILPKPYEAQLDVLKACFDNITTYIVLNGSRQVGKTVICTIAALKWALQQPDQCIMIVSPTDSQVKKIYKQILMMVTSIMFYVKNFRAGSGDSEITFKNNSVILFRSAASENTLRGYSNTHSLLDECAFMKEEIWNTILAPSLSVRGKKCLFCSTPKGNNFFSRLYHKGLDNKLIYKSFKLTYNNNPYANIQFIQEQRLTLPDEIYRQEYLGEFIDSAGCFRNINEIAILNKILYNPSDQYYIGVDIAFKKDYTVAVVLNSKKEMVDFIRFNQSDIGIIINNLKNIITKWKPKKILIESNNQGLPIIQQLEREAVRNISGFATTGQSKPLIINRLIAAFGKNEIKLLKDEIIKSEFNAFTATLSKTGTIKFEAAYGHDDIVMATAIAYECALVNQFTKSFTIN